uniref:synaptotagmin-12 n=1 Tax=Myxine glutinosa TaxID=7769 RepID=UPI00358DF98E
METETYSSTVLAGVGSWEAPLYYVGVVVILLVAGANLWRFCRSGQFPTPSPFPNYNWNYLEEKYGVPRTNRQKRRDPYSSPRTSNPPPLGTYVAYSTSNCQLELMDDLAELPTASDMILSQKSSSLTRHNSLALSVSVESMDSLSSVGQEPWAEPGGGQLEVVLEALSCPPRLSVTLLQGIELQGPTVEDQGEACFVTVVLEPGSHIIGTTAVHQGTLAVTFNECFLVALDLRMSDDAVLRFDVSVVPMESDQALLAGSAELHVSGLDLSATPFSTWLYLQDSSQAEWRGEILLSLSYLPTAERLTVVVVKANNIIWPGDKGSGDPFVKVYLLQNSRKVSKKKTVVKRDDRNPVFNEAIIFSVPANVLQEISVRVTVAEHSSGENVGHVIIGPKCSGPALAHWQQMLSTLRKPVSMWHPLRLSN